MAERSKSTLNTNIDADITTNGVGDITGLKLNNILSDIADSFNNKSDSGRSIWKTGKEYKILAGIVRRVDATTWEILDTGSGHDHMNFSTATVNSDKLDINYGFTATNIVTFGAFPDEEYAESGITFHLSGGLSKLTIEAWVAESANEYNSNGSSFTGSWSTAKSGIASAVWNSGTQACRVTPSNTLGGLRGFYNYSAQSNNAKYTCVVKPLTGIFYDVEFIDIATGVKATTQDANMDFSFACARPHLIDINDYAPPAGSNINVFAILEV